VKNHLKRARNAWAKLTDPIRHEIQVMRLAVEREDAE
jgi:hypothetical protein